MLGLEFYGLTPGDRADLVLVDARTPAGAVAAHPTPAAVIKDGNVVARNGSLV